MAEARTEAFDGYCMTCRETVTVPKGQYKTMANNRGSLRGTCPQCNKTVFKITKKRG
jgi:hypothetical protein